VLMKGLKYVTLFPPDQLDSALNVLAAYDFVGWKPPSSVTAIGVNPFLEKDHFDALKEAKVSLVKRAREVSASPNEWNVTAMPSVKRGEKEKEIVGKLFGQDNGEFALARKLLLESFVGEGEWTNSSSKSVSTGGTKRKGGGMKGGGMKGGGINRICFGSRVGYMDLRGLLGASLVGEEWQEGVPQCVPQCVPQIGARKKSRTKRGHARAI